MPTMVYTTNGTFTFTAINAQTQSEEWGAGGGGGSGNASTGGQGGGGSAYAKSNAGTNLLTPNAGVQVIVGKVFGFHGALVVAPESVFYDVTTDGDDIQIVLRMRRR